MGNPNRMAAADFEAVRPFLKISEDRISAARMHLVDGKTCPEVGELYGWTKQAVWGACAKVWKAFDTLQQSQAAAKSAETIPDGWESATLVAPSAMIARFRAEVATLEPGAPVKKRKPRAKKEE